MSSSLHATPTAPPDPAQCRSFAEFYPYYLSEHRHPTCRRLHVVGTSLGLLWFIATALQGAWAGLPLGLLIGYAFAWVGHFVFEKNRPATFKRPLYSFMGDWAMLRDVLTGRLPF